jgi:acetylornithine/succinyldiaminopimelate/putrescine aminotransferase
MMIAERFVELERMIRVSPPLVTTGDEIDWAVDRIEHVLTVAA